MTEARPSDTFQPGQVLNNTYRIEAILGRGGTSEVYRARSEISGRIVALKVLRPEFASNEAFLLLMTREEAIRDIRHDAVVRYSENHRTHDGVVYLVMDHVEGPGLDQKLKSGGMGADELLVVAARVAEGLHAAHSRNITHRDLSPDNIILRGGNPAEAVIIDFGIAKDDNPGAETIVGNEFAGKYAYAAPEQLNGRSDARSDIYALGALLLATFRGAVPDVGRNPMEVIRRKAEPLDTTGVPEPLRSLIDRMTAPDPEARLQSAEEVLLAIDPEHLATRVPRRPATVPPPPPAPPASAPPPPADPPAEARRRAGGMAVAALAVLVLLLAAGGGWVLGLWSLPQRLPVAAPYTFTAERAEAGGPRATGHVPSAAVQTAIAERMAEQGGQAELELATGAISESWGSDVVELLDLLAPLAEWRLAVRDNAAEVSGLTADRDLRARLNAAALPAGLTGRIEIALGPRRLPAASVQAVLDRLADCGPLVQQDPPAQGYPMGAPVLVSGKLAAAPARVQLYDALAAIAGDRKVVIDADVLNPALCQIEAQMPAAPPGGIQVEFGFGDRPGPNPGGRYFVGENPVIDVVIPEGLDDGFLWVSILDVTGNVYHLLPNLNRPDNSIAALRAGRPGAVPVRVAFSLAEAEAGGKLAFLVDDSTLGKSKVVVIHSARQIFDELRPTTESAAGYAEALASHATGGMARDITLDSRILTTAAK